MSSISQLTNVDERRMAYSKAGGSQLSVFRQTLLFGIT